MFIPMHKSHPDKQDVALAKRYSLKFCAASQLVRGNEVLLIGKVIDIIILRVGEVVEEDAASNYFALESW